MLNQNLAQSMPPGPTYVSGPVRFRGIFTKAEVLMAHPQVIAGLVPAPLGLVARTITIVHLEVTRLLEGFPDDAQLWNELAIEVPVTYNKEPWLYLCQVYCTDMGIIISGRERFGYPKVPGDISVQRGDTSLDVKLRRHGNGAGIMNFSARTTHAVPPRAGMPPGGPGKKMPGVILFKYIPSAVFGGPPDVKQFVTITYGKPVIHRFCQGEGDVEILEGAPLYLQEAGFGSVAELSCMDMELHVLGGEVLHRFQT